MLMGAALFSSPCFRPFWIFPTWTALEKERHVSNHRADRFVQTYTRASTSGYSLVLDPHVRGLFTAACEEGAAETTDASRRVIAGMEKSMVDRAGVMRREGEGEGGRAIGRHSQALSTGWAGSWPGNVWDQVQRVRYVS